jgi:site-specific DNA-methyltransferase (adenine-specific)
LFCATYPTGLPPCVGTSSLLTISNINWFKYCLVWEKEVGTNFLSANYQPLKVHEDIVVFSPAASSYSSRGTMTYNPQMANRRPISGGKKASRGDYRFHVQPQAMRLREEAETCHPRSVILCAREMGSHGTQKPVALMEYLVRTYSNDGDTVLDPFAGSGTTGLACLNTGRHFIGIESDPAYFAIAERRLDAASNQTPLFAG